MIFDTSALLFLPYSQFLYDITHNDGTSPAALIVKNWIKMIGSKVGIAIKYTQRVSTLLVNRANYLRRKMKTLSGGAPRRNFFQKHWAPQLEAAEVVTHERIQQAEERVEQLQDRVTSLETE